MRGGGGVEGVESGVVVVHPVDVAEGRRRGRCGRSGGVVRGQVQTGGGVGICVRVGD